MWPPSRNAVSSLSWLCAGLFAVSICFPVVASLYPADLPAWAGVIDVVFAAFLLIATIALNLRSRSQVDDQDRLDAFRVAQRLVAIIPALLLVFFIFGHRVNWTVLVVGVAWRAWLLFYSLPHFSAARRLRSATRSR
jgi:hypothetical protein